MTQWLSENWPWLSPTLGMFITYFVGRKTGAKGTTLRGMLASIGGHLLQLGRKPKN